MRSTLRPVVPAWLLLAALLLSSGCAARWAYREGLGEAKKGNWDLAVARLTRALQKDPENIGYKIALENARSQASRQHQLEGRKHLAADDLEKAEEELGIAVNFDPANRAAVDDLAMVREKARQREDEKQRQAALEASRAQGQGAQYPVPVLSPRSPVAISMSFPDQSLEKVFTALGKAAGVNVLFDEGYRDKPKVTVNLMGVSFEEALEQLTFSNRLFYKVLDRNTIIIVPESQPKRRQYDDIFLRTFYLRNTETKDVEAVVKGVLGAQGKVASNATLGAITVTGTIDQLALAERVIEANDKARGEVVVELQILEVDRKRLKQYGIELSNYSAGVTLSPTGAENEVKDGLLNVRAHLLSSLNLSDFIVSIPATLSAKFLQTEGTARILASPKLRAAEGKKTTLKIGSEVPIPVTTFTAAQTGGATFAPATSFQYKNVGVNLQITPRIAAGGEITLEMMAEFSAPGADSEIAGQKLPSFLTRNVDGVLRLRDGETTLLGGLLQRNEASTLKGVIGLQDIPILGPLFSSHTNATDDTEILISITPRLVRAPRVTAADLTPLYLGTQEISKVPSARPPLFGAPEEPAAGPSPAPGPSPQASPGAGAGRPSPAPSAPPPAARPAVAAALSPLEATMKPGESTGLSVIVMNAQDLTVVEVVVAFDPALFEGLDAAAGSLMTLGGVSVGAERSIEPGRVRVKFSRATGVAGSGVVAAVTLKGVKAGAGSVAVESLTVTTASGREQVRVSAPVRLTVQP